MTAENKDPFYDPSEEIEGNLQQLLQLAERLEWAAQSYSEDYREGLEDSCSAAVGSADLGNTLETDLSFHVERLREESASGILGDPISATYTISSTFKRRYLAVHEIPQSLVDFLLESTEYTPDELEDEDVEYALGFSQTFTISSEGDFEHDYGLNLYIDDDEIELPDAVLETIQGEPIPASDESRTGVDDEFLNLFQAEDLIALKGIANQIVKEHERKSVLNRFCDELSKMRHVTQSMRYKMVDNLLSQMFFIGA